MLNKIIEIILRRSNKKDSINKFLTRVLYNLIQLLTIYNNKKWVSYFHYYFTNMNFVYIYAKKSQNIKIVTNFLNIVKI